MKINLFLKEKDFEFPARRDECDKVESKTWRQR